jgi:hypothetical protein
MNCIGSGSATVTERSELTARGHWRFRWMSGLRTAVQRAQSGGAKPDLSAQASRRRDIIAFLVFSRLCERPTLRDPSEILLLRGIAAIHEAIRDWKRSCCRSWETNCVSVDMGPAQARRQVVRRPEARR